MSAKELHYSRKTKHSPSASTSISKTIIASVIASLLVAFAINGATLVIAISKMTVMVEHIERRVTTLEMETKATLEGRHLLEVNMARQSQVLDRMQNDLQDIKQEIKSFHKN